MGSVDECLPCSVVQVLFFNDHNNTPLELCKSTVFVDVDFLVCVEMFVDGLN